MSGGGTSTSGQTTQTSSKTQPWAPTVPGLKNIIGGINSQFPNYEPTSAETGALDTIMGNAQKGNPFTGRITSLANDLLGGGTDRSGMVNDAYSQYQQQAQPFLDPSYLDPASNPAFKGYMDTISNDVSNRVNSMFAGAGRDMSGMNQQSLARGIAEGTAPVFANQYNQNVSTQRGMMDSLFGAGGQTAGLLSGLDQTALGNRSAGVDAAGRALNADNYGANSILEAEAMRRGLPLGNLGQLSSLLLPIAGLGQQTSGTSTSAGTATMAPAQQFATWTQGINNLMPRAPVKF